VPESGINIHTDGDFPLNNERHFTTDDCESFWLKSVLSRIEEENAAPSTMNKYSDDFSYNHLKSNSAGL